MPADKDLTDDQIVWGMCEMKSATEDIYKGQPPWVVYYNQMFAEGKVVPAEGKQVREFVVEERAARIFAKDHLKVGDIIRLELEFTDAFEDDFYVSGYKLSPSTSG